MTKRILIGAKILKNQRRSNKKGEKKERKEDKLDQKALPNWYI
jgi:hypothetical protein